MNILLGIVLVATGGFLLIRSYSVVHWLTHTTDFFVHSDASTWRENIIVVGILMVIAGLVFCML